MLVRETNYSIIKECLANKWAILVLQCYLVGHPFTLCSEHTCSNGTMTKHANVRITHWYPALQPFQLEVVHRQGEQMVVVDYL